MSKFPEREAAEVTPGHLVDYETGEQLGPASDRQTYLSLQVKHVWSADKGVFSENYATHVKRVYVRDGRVQDKETGKVWA